MALFPSNDVRPDEEATRRRAVTQEAGTRKLVIAFVTLLVVWFLGSKAWDIYLLRHSWPKIAVEDTGLSVISTLDRRGAYDSNLFKVVQVEGDARAELTTFGWDGIFNGRHGPLSSANVGSAIRSAIGLDSETGFAMLEPILAAEVRLQMGDMSAYDALTVDYGISTAVPITDEEKRNKRATRRTKSIRELIDFFEQEAAASRRNGDAPTEGGSNSQQHVEHGLVIPGAILARACPLVLSGRHFAHGRVEEHPEVIMGGKTYSLWLDLTPEGRSRFYQWSHGHANENLMLILNGEVVAHGRIAMTMDVSTWEITNLKDGVAAQKLVGFINGNSVGH